jgi:hypothetical protein
MIRGFVNPELPERESKRLPVRGFRSRGKHLHDPKRETFRSIRQILFFLLHSFFLLQTASP